MWRKLFCLGAVVFGLLLLPDRLATQEGSVQPREQQALQDDLQRMQTILNQMRTNLAFVGSNTTPLNHQFELEIEMWQAFLNHMEHRLPPQPQKPGQ